MKGDRLQELRKDANLTQAELGEILSVSAFSVSYYERGKCEPNDATKTKIARFFNVSLDYLVGLIDEPLPLDERNKKMLVLPDNLSESARKEIKNYISYVQSKYKGPF